MKKNILIFYSQINHFGGIERLLLDIADTIKKKKLNLIILCYENKLKFEKFRDNIKIIKYKKNKNLFITSNNFKKKINQVNYLGTCLAFDYSSIIYLYISKQSKYNCYLVDPPNLITKTKFKNFYIFHKVRELIKELIIKKSLHHATKVMAMTKTNGNDFYKFYNIKPIIVYPGCNIKKIKQKKTKNFNYKNLRFLTISRIEKNKNIDWLLYLLRKILQQKKELEINKISLDVVGKGKDEGKIKKIISKFKLNNIIKLHGFVSEKKKQNLLKNCSINLIPGYQGYGIPVLESLFLGIPTVVNSASRVSEVLGTIKIAKITPDNKKKFIDKTINFIKFLKKEKKVNLNLKKLPTAENWTNHIASLCGWYK